MNINELNNDCLIYIFEQLYDGNFSTWIRQRLICKRWRDIIEHNILNRKKSLKLFKQFSEIKYYYYEIERENAIETDCFKIKPSFNCQFDIVISYKGALLSYEIENFLIRLFPLLEELVVYQNGNFMYYLHPFLNQTNHLTSLTLGGEIDYCFPDCIIVQEFLNVVYGLPQLKKLNIMDVGLVEQLTEEGMRRICPQLSQLSLGIINFKPFFLTSLTSNCTYLRLDILDDYFNVMKFLKENELPQLNRLNKLRISSLYIESQNLTAFLNVICEKFLNLEYLDFSQDKMRDFVYLIYTIDHNVISNLRKLTNLTELRLSHVLFNNPNGQLPTIERLHLSNLNSNFIHSEEFWPKVSHIFPNITELNCNLNSRISDLKNYFPKLVSLKKLNFNSKFSTRFYPCPFSHFYRSNDEYWSV